MEGHLLPIVSVTVSQQRHAAIWDETKWQIK
jgi:hypothetical protein